MSCFMYTPISAKFSSPAPSHSLMTELKTCQPQTLTSTPPDLLDVTPDTL